MGQDDIMRITVGQHAAGIVGLKRVVEEVSKQASDKEEEVIREELLERLSKSNYIPAVAREDYGDAFLREYNKHLGRPYEKEQQQVLEIKILGPGCNSCNTLAQMTMEVLDDMGLAADVEHVTDVKEIGRYGVMGTPALLINGKVVSVVVVPQKRKLKQWLTQHR
jgi:small redox-active disulfide protein 2